MNAIFSDKVEMLRSNKGGAKIIYKGYMYTIHKRVQGRIRWRCSQRTLHCKGSITTGNGTTVINLPHNHIPDMHAIARARCRSIIVKNDTSKSLSSQNCAIDVIPLQNSDEPFQVEQSELYTLKEQEMHFKVIPDEIKTIKKQNCLSVDVNNYDNFVVSAPLLKEMENWQIRRTSRGIRLIDGKGYTYTKDRHVGNKSYWRCDYRPWKCKARASLNGASTLGVGDRNKAHLMFNLMSHGHQPTMRRKSKSDNDNDNEFEEDFSDSHLNKSLLKPASNQGSSTKSKQTSSSQLSVPKPPPSPESEMCLRWNSHHANMSTVIPALMDDERYVDVTLVAEGSLLKCHKLILSSCSPYFDEMLKNTNSTQQTIIFLRGIKFWQIKALVDFMYKGEVNVDQSKLESLLQAAEDLQIKGLAGKAPKKEHETITNDSFAAETSEPEIKSEQNSNSENYLMDDDDDEEYFPHNEYRRVKYRKNRKRKISTPPDPSLLKHVKINLKGTKSRPNIKQPKFYSPDYPEYDPDRCVSPPKLETDPVFHIDNIKLEPIDIEVPQSPTFFEMNSMMDKSISEIQDKHQTFEDVSNKSKETIYISESSKNSDLNKLSDIQPSTSKDILIEKAPQDPLAISKMDKIKIVRDSGQSPGKDILNLNKKAIIVKCQNVKKLIDENSSIQKILDSATAKQTLTDSEKSKLPQIRVRNLPTTETMLKKFATTQLTSILKKGGDSPQQHIILKKVGTTKPTILRHSLPAKTKEFTTQVEDVDDTEITQKISLLAKTKKEKEEIPETKEDNDGETTDKKEEIITV